MNTKKIKVKTGLNENGAVVPKQIIWYGFPGRKIYEISKVLSVSASYTVMIGNAKRNLYRFGSEWYVEIANEQK